MSSGGKTPGGGNDAMAVPAGRSGPVSPLNPSVAAFEFTSPSSSVPSSPGRASIGSADGDEDVSTALTRHLSYYFSDQNLAKDAFLVSHMNADMFVPCALVAGFPKIQSRTTDIGLVVETLRALDNVEVDAEGTMVRPRNYLLLQSPRGTLIVRDVPIGPSARKHVEKLLVGGPKAQTIQSDNSGRWFISFESEDAGQAALKHVQGKTVEDKPITASVKKQGPLLRGGGLVPPPFGPGGPMMPGQGGFMPGYPGYFDPNFAYYGQPAVMPPWAQPYHFPPGMVPSFPVGPGMSAMVPGQPMAFMRNPAQFAQPGQSNGGAQNSRRNGGRADQQGGGGRRHNQSSNSDRRGQQQAPQHQQSQNQHRRTSSQGNDSDKSSSSNSSSSGSKRGNRGKSQDPVSATNAGKGKKSTKAASDSSQKSAPSTGSSSSSSSGGGGGGGGGGASTSSGGGSASGSNAGPHSGGSRDGNSGNSGGGGSGSSSGGGGGGGGSSNTTSAGGSGSNNKKKEPAAPKQPAPELAIDNFPSLPGGKPSKSSETETSTTASSTGWNQSVKMTDIVKRKIPTSPTRDSKPAPVPSSPSGKAPEGRGASAATPANPDASKSSEASVASGADSAASQPTPKPAAAASKKATTPTQQDKPAPKVAVPAHPPKAEAVSLSKAKPAWGKGPSAASAAAIVSGRASTSANTISAPKTDVTSSVASQGSSAGNATAKSVDSASVQPKSKAPVKSAGASAEQSGTPAVTKEAPPKAPEEPTVKSEAPKSAWGQSSGSKKPSFAEMLRGKK